MHPSARVYSVYPCDCHVVMLDSVSNLPYKVDVVDWHSMDPAFQALIQNKRVVIQRPITPSQERQTR